MINLEKTSKEKRRTWLTIGLGVLLTFMCIISIRICTNKNNHTESALSSIEADNEISVPDDWIEYDIEGSFTLSIPPTMELRHVYDEYTRWLTEGIRYIGKADAVFQQNELSIKSPEAYNTYARVLVQHYEFSPGDVERYYQYPELTDSVYAFLDELVIEEVKPAELIDSPIWETININTNGTKAIEGTYKRTGVEGPVKCKFYLLSNYCEMAKIIIAYREKDNDIWQEDLEKVIYSFKWNNLR